MSVTAKPGDNVRFLNSIGGGRVARIDGAIAYVEDEDGFEVPMPLRECVVVDPERSLGFTERPSILPKEKPAPKAPAPAPKTPEIIRNIETPDGDVLNIVLGFEPTSLKALSTSEFEAYLINDSNYWLYCVIATRESCAPRWTTRFAGSVEPNMEAHVFTLAQADLPECDRMLVQYVAYKDDRTFEAKDPATLELKLDTTKFAKLHCFGRNTYFEGPVLALDITRDDKPCRPQPVPEARLIAESMKTPEARKDKPAKVHKASKPAPRNDEPIVVDLHASELFDDMRGLTNADILNRQIDVFTEVMEANLHAAGRKIVFIHGKGEGVLRHALIKELNHRFKGHDVQDASFREYGWGATQVTIRPMAAQKAGKGK